MADQSAATEADKRAVINLWRAYPKLKAVKHDRVVFGISDIFFVPGLELSTRRRPLRRCCTQR
jgi:hypothetical protein